MDVHSIYPKRKNTSFWRRNRQDILRSSFLIAGYSCLLINLLTNPWPWSLIVIGGLCVFWIAFIYRPLVEHTLIKKLSDISLSVCLYLLLLDRLVGGDWGGLVVPIVFFSLLTAIGAFYLLFFKKEKRNFMPLFELLLGSIIAVTGVLVIFHELNWAQIVLASLSLGLLLLTGILFPKEMTLELRKKLHH